MGKLSKIAEFYKALGDETRLEIIKMLSEKEMCVCEINESLKMTQPAISHHLKILKQACILKDSKEGKWTYYSLNMDVFKEVFSDNESLKLLEAFMKPMELDFSRVKPSEIRNDPALCEKLTKFNKNTLG